MLDLYIDADACPVKDETYRVAARYGLRVFVVSAAGVRPPQGGNVTAVVVGDRFDAADDWIAERVGRGDVVITADIPLAARCVDQGALVVTPQGRKLDSRNVSAVRATRDLMAHLREAGTVTGGPAPFSRKDRSRFLAALDETVQAIRRGP